MTVTRSTKELTGPIMGMDITKEKMNSTKKCVKRDYKNQKKEATRTISDFHMTNKPQKGMAVTNSEGPIVKCLEVTNWRSQLLIVLYLRHL